jgi:hypothetical protein
MGYTKQNFENGKTLDASQLNHIEDGIVNCFTTQIELSSTDNLDDIKTVGEYFWSYDNGGVPINAPVEKSTMMMSVFVANASSGTYKTVIGQLVTSSKYGVFFRNSSKNSGKFDAWMRLDKTESGASSGGGGIQSYYERKARLMGEQWTRTFTVDGATYPNYGGTSTGYIKQGASQKGIIYSSTFRDGTDALWNFNPSTYYSAVANPASLLYTVDNRNRVPNVFNEAAYMGSVCSTTALKACGYLFPYDSTEIRTYWKEKRNHKIDNLEVGDVLWKQGHVASIVGINANANGHVDSVLVIEQASNVKVFEKTAAEWDSYFTYWTTIYRNDEVLDTTQELPINYPDNFTIIYEKGNNTYVEDSSKMLFYIPLASKVYIKKENGAFAEYDKSSFDTEIVNDITVYDLASCFSGIGNYYLHTDENTTDICIKLINTGSVSIANGKATLNGYENCKPHAYRVIEILAKNNTNYNFWFAPEGYTSKHVLNSFEFIESDSFDIKHIPGHGKYKLEVFFDTDYGWCRLLSDNIGL